MSIASKVSPTSPLQVIASHGPSQPLRLQSHISRNHSTRSSWLTQWTEPLRVARYVDASGPRTNAHCPARANPSPGNDPELDPDRAPEPPTKAIDKPIARTGKRNAPAEAPLRPTGPTSRAPKDSGNANDNCTSFCTPASDTFMLSLHEVVTQSLFVNNQLI